MKAPEDFYRGTNKLEKHRGNSQEAYEIAKKKKAKGDALKKKMGGKVCAKCASARHTTENHSKHGEFN